jgi:hypothetical protein
MIERSRDAVAGMFNDFPERSICADRWSALRTARRWPRRRSAPYRAARGRADVARYLACPIDGESRR